jgi:hypothetical protein
MRKLITVALAVACMQAYSAQAIQMSTSKYNAMVKTCSVQEGDVADAACRAFVQGVVDTTAFYSTAKLMTPLFCIPVEITPDQMVTVYRDHLKKNHSLRQFSAAVLAVSAFKSAFACEQAAGS